MFKHHYIKRFYKKVNGHTRRFYYIGRFSDNSIGLIEIQEGTIDPIYYSKVILLTDDEFNELKPHIDNERE